MEKIKRKLTGIIEVTFFALIFSGLIVYRKNISGGVYEGIMYSVGVLIPSIMPCMFMASLLCSSRIYRGICKAVNPITRYLFRLPADCGGVILAGLTCGYPVGAKLTSELLNENRINKDEAKRLFLFCVNPGIPFCILFLGGEVFGSLSYGSLLYGAVTVSNILTGILMSIGSDIPGKTEAAGNNIKFSEAVKKAADSTAGACLTMVMYIVLFKGLFALLHASGVYQFIVEITDTSVFSAAERAGILSFLLEVTTGTADAASLKLSPVIFSFGLGFGGVCIILQLMAFFKEHPAGLLETATARLLQGLVSSCIISIYSFFFPFEEQLTEVFSSSGTMVIGGIEAKPLGLFCLLILFGIYIVSGRKFTMENSVRK